MAGFIVTDRNGNPVAVTGNHAGIVDGYGDETLRPGNDSTRAAAAKIFKNFFERIIEQ